MAAAEGPRVADCPYCLEKIKPGARKCPHCQSSLETSTDGGGNVVYILDKGLVRFGKFIGAALGAFLIVGVYVYGLDLKDATKRTSEAEIEVKQALLSIEQQKAALEGKVTEINKSLVRIGELEQDIVRHRDETQKNVAEMQEDLAEVKELIGDIRSQKDIAVGLVVELRQKALDPAEQKVAAAQREERGIQAGRGKLWKVGSTLRFRFLDGNEKQKEIVRAAITEWAAQINLGFTETGTGEAELRISFRQPGSWSYEGTDALGIAKNEATINYGTLPQVTDTDVASQTALHEFGHALGLQHEFQNPSAGDVFNVKALYDYFDTSTGRKSWVDSNFVAKVDYPGSRAYDPESVMNYSLPPGVFISPEKQTRPGPHLSESDKRYVASLYPRSYAQPVRAPVGQSQ